MSGRVAGALLLVLIGAGSALGEPMGGIGPVRLGMGEAEAEAALRTIAHELHAIERVSVERFAAAPMADYVVLRPWERVLTATIESGVRIQVGFDRGHVITVTSKETIKADPETCKAMNLDQVKALRETYHDLAQEGPDYREASFYKASYDGWTLWQGYISQRSTRDCSLTTEFTSDEDERVQQEWRGHR